MFKNIITTAYRNILHNRGYTIINVFGLALGIGVFCLIMSYVSYQYGADNFQKNYEDIYRIELDERFAVTPITMKQTISDRFPEIKSTRYFPRWGQVSHEQKKIESKLLFVDAEFFEIFSYEAIQGDIGEIMDEPSSALVTESWAKKMFGEEDAIGKVITYNRELDLEIRGILKDPEHCSQLKVDDIVAPLHSMRDILDFENSWFSNYVTYLLIPENEVQAGKVEQINAFFRELHDKRNPNYPIFYLRPFKELYFDNSKFDYSNHGNRSTVLTFWAAALFIILIACSNYINLSTAKAVLRARETGVRKTLGSHRWQLILQFLVESVLLCLLAFVVTLIMIRLFYPAFSNYFRIHQPFFSIERLLLMLAIALITGILAGLYPAFYQTRFQPAEVLKGSTVRDSRGLLLRRILIILQFTISIAMIICTLTVYDQLQCFLEHDLGFDKEQVIAFGQTKEIMEQRGAFKQEVLESAYIEECCYMYLPMGKIIVSGWYIEQGDTEENKKKYRSVITEPDFLDVYGVELVRGRSFNPEMETDRDNVIVNQTFANEFIDGDPLEYTIWENTQIIGVVKDFAYRPLQYEIEPMVMFWEPEETYAVAVRIQPENIEAVEKHLEAVYHKFSPDADFEYNFQGDIFAKYYLNEKRFGRIFSYFAGLAVIIACLGMFGLASFLINNRRKEIGIRKVLGASAGSVIVLLNREFSWNVIIAGILAIPVSWYVMKRWMENFAVRVPLNPYYFCLAILAALVISWLTVSWQTLKAASINPAETLKYE